MTFDCLFYFIQLRDVLGGIVLGKLSDGAGICRRRSVVIFGTIAYVAALGLTWYLKVEKRDIAPLIPSSMDYDSLNLRGLSWVAYLAAFLYGITDASYNTQIYAVFGSLYPEEGRVTFTLFQIFQQIGGIMGFAFPIFIPIETTIAPMWIQLFFVMLSCVTFSCVRMDDKSKVVT